MSFLTTLISAFKGGGDVRVPVAGSFVSPWSTAFDTTPTRPAFDYSTAIREAYLANPVAQRSVRIVAEGIGGAPLSCDTPALERLVQCACGSQPLLETVRTHLIAWLRADSALAFRLNAIEEESPAAASPPWLGIAASAAADWSGKTFAGREVRVALELVDRNDDGATTAEMVALIERRIATMAPVQEGYRVVATQFLRSRAERRGKGLRAVLVEYRFRLLMDF